MGCSVQLGQLSQGPLQRAHICGHLQPLAGQGGRTAEGGGGAGLHGWHRDRRTGAPLPRDGEGTLLKRLALFGALPRPTFSLAGNSVLKATLGAAGKGRKQHKAICETYFNPNSHPVRSSYRPSGSHPGSR